MAEKDNSKVDNPMLFNALTNMRKFRASQKLAQAALLFMGSKVSVSHPCVHVALCACALRACDVCAVPVCACNVCVCL